MTRACNGCGAYRIRDNAELEAGCVSRKSSTDQTYEYFLKLRNITPSAKQSLPWTAAIWVAGEAFSQAHRVKMVASNTIRIACIVIDRRAWSCAVSSWDPSASISFLLLVFLLWLLATHIKCHRKESHLVRRAYVLFRKAINWCGTMCLICCTCVFLMLIIIIMLIIMYIFRILNQNLTRFRKKGFVPFGDSKREEIIRGVSCVMSELVCASSNPVRVTEYVDFSFWARRDIGFKLVSKAVIWRGDGEGTCSVCKRVSVREATAISGIVSRNVFLAAWMLSNRSEVRELSVCVAKCASGSASSAV